ncbi:MAG: ABC transporter ATP-binding protein [Flavobacteriaceae bacterium]|nr:ABC transporter ATP-binding protein [Flavobacteriaceae bacterium]
MESFKPNIAMQVKDLTIGYRKKSEDNEIGTDINFQLWQGELIALVGPNGIGKSTLLRTLCDIQTRLNGSIEVGGRDIGTYSALELAQLISVVLTDPPATRALSVGEIVTLGRQPYTNWIGKLTEQDKSHIENAIETTEISNLVNRKAFELSDGQLQKVMIARALAQDTDIIILDEPTTHLDMHHKAHILSLLRSLARNSGKTILFSTHEIDLGIELCDKLIVMGSENTEINTADGHILNGNFDALFPSDLIEFDSSRRLFRIKK